jgi:hypothetical protein
MFRKTIGAVLALLTIGTGTALAATSATTSTGTHPVGSCSFTHHATTYTPAHWLPARTYRNSRGVLVTVPRKYVQSYEVVGYTKTTCYGLHLARVHPVGTCAVTHYAPTFRAAYWTAGYSYVRFGVRVTVPRKFHESTNVLGYTRKTCYGR